jgi:hypothetical protein
MNGAVDLIDVSFPIVGFVVVFVGGLWAYTHYVLERGRLPHTQLSVDAVELKDTDAWVLDVTITVH